MCHEGPPTRSWWGGYHLARPGAPPEPKNAWYQQNQTSNLKPCEAVDRALERRLCLGPLSQIPELRVGPALPPLSMGWAVDLGGGVCLGVRGGVMGTGGGGGPGGVLIVLCRGGAWGLGMWTFVDPWVSAHSLRFGVGLGSAVVAVVGHLLDVG